MDIYHKEHVLYGLDNYTILIKDIIEELDAKDYEFDIKMILNEAIANAFYHGNNSDDKLPIHVRYILDCNSVTFEIEDCGRGSESLNKLKCHDVNDVLAEGNRGLFLVDCYADNVEFYNKVLRVQKSIAARKR